MQLSELALRSQASSDDIPTGWLERRLLGLDFCRLAMIFKRSLVNELANSVGGVFTVLFTIVIAVGMVRILSLAAGGRIDNAAVLQMVLYNALVNLPPLLAVSLFIAVLMTMMRWWQDNEMVVWFSSGGRSLFSWVGPTMRFALPIIAGVALLSMVISPWARAQSEMIREQFKQRDEVNAIAPGRFIESMGGKRIFFIESVDEHSNEVGRVFMAENGRDKESVVTAQAGRIELNDQGDRYVVLQNGRRYETASNSAETRLIEFDRYGVRLDIKVDQPFRASRTASQPLTFLFANRTPENAAELVWRFSWPLAAFNLALLAIPLSCTSPRAGRSLNLIVAALIFVLYLNGISIAETYVEQQKLSLLGAVVGLNGTVLLVAVLLFVRQVYLQRWLPVWLTPWHLKQKLEARKAARSGKGDAA